MNNQELVLKELRIIQENTLACLKVILAMGESKVLTDTQVKVLEQIKQELSTMNLYLLKLSQLR